MANPVLVYNASYIYFTCDRDPTTSEPIVSAAGIPSNWLFYWWNLTTNDIFVCQDGSASPLAWFKQANSANIASMIGSSLGWDLNTPRAYTPVTLAFNTARAPSETNDVLVLANISQTSTLIASSNITVQIDSGSGFEDKANLILSGVAASLTQCCTFLVPKGSSYKIIKSSGAGSIAAINEITL